MWQLVVASDQSVPQKKESEGVVGAEITGTTCHARVAAMKPSWSKELLGAKVKAFICSKNNDNQFCERKRSVFVLKMRSWPIVDELGEQGEEVLINHSFCFTQ